MGMIKTVKAADTQLLRYLNSLGLLPGVRVEVQFYSPFDHNLTVKARQRSMVLGVGVTSKIFVEVL
jgi:DtxR family Mn-dependent transcriptional regulator